MKLGQIVDIPDGREDFYLIHNGKEALVIRQEFYPLVGITYDQIRTPEGLSDFLMRLAIVIARQNFVKGPETPTPESSETTSGVVTDVSKD
jgi:hypothetical protein